MVPDTLLFYRQDDTNTTDNCPPCPAPPPCNCAANEQCIQLPRQCNSCNVNQCVPLDSSTTSSSHGISAGAVAGAVVASVVFLAAMVLAFLWYRRRSRLRAAAAGEEDGKAEEPARAEDVLNRPDPNEKANKPEVPQEQNTVRIYAGTSNTTINLDPEAQGESSAGASGQNPVRASVQSNPFTDTHSIQSASTGTQSNVIPIALVPPGSVGSLRSSVPSTQATSGTGPARPVRTPDLDLNLDHANVSSDSVRTGPRYAQSTRSGMTNLRTSILTTGSYSSDFLNEAPIIVTPTTRTVKQVVGLVKAEVIRTPPGSSSSVYSSEDGGTPKTASSVAARTPGRSPLAGTSFGPSDMHDISEEHEEQELAVRTDPFGDEHSPYATVSSPSTVTRTSPAPTAATFGDSEENWDPQGPRMLTTEKGSTNRPESFMTQAGSIISADIGTAARVHLGLDQLSYPPMPTRTLGVPPRQAGDLPHTPISAALSTPRSPYRMTSAKLVSPQVSVDDQTPMPSRGALEAQQRRAFEELDARMSRSSVVSSTSTRADSILEGFPFVPPSPISDRPIRTPPRSPLAQQAFGNGQQGAGVGSPLKNASTDAVASEPLPPPPNRKQLGMSTASQSSTMSNGLGSFPFQIDSGNGPEAADAAAARAAGNVPASSSSPPSSFQGRQRASLDTLALTSDLSSYPLGFDKAAMENYPGPPPRRS